MNTKYFPKAPLANMNICKSPQERFDLVMAMPVESLYSITEKKMKFFTIKLIAVYVTLALENAAFSHDGHGLTGSHWHASDAGGFVAFAIAVVVAVWLSRGGK